MEITPDLVGLSLLVLGVLLIVGKLVRVRSSVAQTFFLPSSIIGGGLALLLGPDVLGAAVRRLAGEGTPFAEGAWPEPFLEVWGALPALLISVVFATLFLGERLPPVRRAVDLGAPQVVLGIAIASGQLVIGLVLAVLVLTPVFGLDPMAGALIEIGFLGGHGTAAGLGGTFSELGFAEGQDLALGLATVGVVSGVVLGIGLINWGVRTGRAEVLDSSADLTLAEQRGVYEKDEQPVGSRLTVRPASVEPLAIHLAVVGVAVLVGLAVLEGLQRLEALLWADSIELLAYVPLFPLAMLGGVVVQLVLDRTRAGTFVDRRMMRRIQGVALDLLIISALATLSVQAIAEDLVPFLALAAGGLAWGFGSFLLLAPRMLPDHWFERGIGDLGQTLGFTATGIILIRVADPGARTPALEAFGYKQLGFEPFFGGGLVTVGSLPLIAQFGPVPLLVAMSVLLVASLAVGLLLLGPGRRWSREAVPRSSAEG